MKKLTPDRILLTISVFGYTIMSWSFIFMPFESIAILPGCLFWGGLLIGCAFQIVLEARRRAFFKRYHIKREKMQKPKNGLLSFASNKYAKIADIATAVSVVATILVLLLTKGFGFLCYVCIAITLQTFCLHCILNGRIYFHTNNQERIRQVLEQKNASTRSKGEGEI